jgi:hypothetical protein
LLHQDTQASGVASASPPAAVPNHDDGPAATEHARSPRPPEGHAEGRQAAKHGLGLASSGGMRPPAIPTVLGAGGYVMDMKSVTGRQLRGSRAPDATRCVGRPEGTLR